MTRSLEIGGLNIKFRLSKIASVPSERKAIYFEHLPNGSWRILSLHPDVQNINDVTEFKVIRDGDDRYLDLVGAGKRLQITASTCLNVRYNFIHMDEIAPDQWRLSYSSALIPDFTKVTSLIIHSEEDVL